MLGLQSSQFLPRCAELLAQLAHLRAGLHLLLFVLLHLGDPAVELFDLGAILERGFEGEALLLPMGQVDAQQVYLAPQLFASFLVLQHAQLKPFFALGQAVVKVSAAVGEFLASGLELQL